jgi:hypothetical protein
MPGANAVEHNAASMTNFSNDNKRVKRARLGVVTLMMCFSVTASGSTMGLLLEPAQMRCAAPVPKTTAKPPLASANRLADSHVVPGTKDLAWVWLGSPTPRYPHAALGSIFHAATLHVTLAGQAVQASTLVYELPLRKVFEDLLPRLIDLDGDGRDEIILVESDLSNGSSLVVLGVRQLPIAGKAGQANVIVELARSNPTGSTFRWLNPVGAADFDGDGVLDLASVTTPHIGGVLTLYHFKPPHLLAFAKAMDVSNHRMGDVEQQMAVVVLQAGLRPTVLVPDMKLQALHALRWDAPGKWTELADAVPMPFTIARMFAVKDGACVGLADGSWWYAKVVK